MPTDDPKLIQLVTSRYRQMQGLATMADAGYPLIGGSGLLLLTEEWHAVIFGVVLLGYLGARVTVIRRWIDAYYSDRYGRAVRPVWVSAIGVDLCIVISYGQIIRQMFHAPVTVQMILMAIGLCSYPLWVAMRDFQYRGYWLLLAGAGMAAALELPFYQFDKQIYVWSAHAQLVIGCALFAVGALDHRLLTRTLHVAQSSQAQEPEPQNP